MRNKIRYTYHWLINKSPVPYGEPFTIKASKRIKRKVLKEYRKNGNIS